MEKLKKGGKFYICSAVIEPDTGVADESKEPGEKDWGGLRGGGERKTVSGLKCSANGTLQMYRKCWRKN